MATTKTTEKQRAKIEVGTVSAKKVGTRAEKTTNAKDRKRVLFVSSEVQPFAGSGGLGEVAGSLPNAINKASKDYEVSVIMPYYKSLMAAEYKEHCQFVGNFSVDLAWRHQYCGVFKLVRDGVTYYFLDNEYYFDRGALYGHYDDGERFAFFSKAVLETLPWMDAMPQIVHCNDWQTALTPVYYKLYYMYRFPYENIKFVFTIHNIEYQGKFGDDCCEDLFGIPARERGSISHDGCINLMKAAMDYSDCLSTVSQTYANEIKTDFFAHGLANIVTRNSGKLSGILNGIDYHRYDPLTDKALFVNFDKTSLALKKDGKAALQKLLNLTVDTEVPMVAMITRLVPHKGVDLVKFAAQNMLRLGIQLVVLGTGNGEFEEFFKHLAKQYPTKVAAVIAFNEDLSRKIYGGADIFLMPSKSEPCGLSQMIASRYGTVSVVRETGGLFDSIHDCGDGRVGNGFTFATYNGDDMLHAVERAVGLYRDYPEIWKDLILRVMDEDFSWNRSALQYVQMYNRLLTL